MNHTLKKNLLYVISLFAIVIAVSLSVNVMPVKADTPSLSRTSITLKVGDRAYLTLNDSVGKVTWKSTDTAVAKVSSKGTVIAKKKGKAVISATCSGKTYTCKVRVNRTFSLSEDEIRIKKNYYIDAILSVDGAVNAVVSDPSICSVSFGEWEGDVMPLTVIPKKKGSTTVKFTNTANSEYYVLKVTVAAVPITITFEEFTTTDGSPYMVTGYNEALFRVKTNKKASSGKLRIYDADGKAVKTFTIGKMKAKTIYEVQWDGTNSLGYNIDGRFTYALIADSNKKQGGTMTVYSSSPFGEGDGSVDKPFKVSDSDDIVNMRYFNGANFVQDKDINFNYSSVASLYPADDPFKGTYDGASHKLKNYVGYYPIFGYVGEKGEIKNVIIESGAINEAPAILCVKNEGQIVDCSINASVISAKGNNTAALYCQVNTGEIRTCKASGTIRLSGSVTSESPSFVTGSICAQNEGFVIDCTSSVNITQEITLAAGSSSSAAASIICSGGLVGINGAGAFTINCEYSGIILASDTNSNMSGFCVGYAVGYNKAYVGVCRYTGKSTNMKSVGGGSPEM